MISLVSIAGSKRRWTEKIDARAGGGRPRPPTRHVRILQLAGERRAVRARRRDAPGRARRRPPASCSKDAKRLLPVGAELGAHAAASRRPSPSAARRPAASAARRHIRAAAASGTVAMSCATFISGPLRPPSMRASSAACAAAVGLAPERPRADHPRRKAADAGADPRIARKPARQPVRLVVAG